MFCISFLRSTSDFSFSCKGWILPKVLSRSLLLWLHVRINDREYCMRFWGSYGRVHDEVEVARTLVVQGACLFSGVWGQCCILFLSIYSQWCSSEIFLPGFLLLRCAKIGPFDPVCLTDYARYQWRTPNLSKSGCSPLPPIHTHRHTHLFTFSLLLCALMATWRMEYHEGNSLRIRLLSSFRFP